MYELPPILTGTSSQQITALRAYLVRMAQQLNSAADAPGTYIEFSSVSGVAYISTIAALNDTISTASSAQLTNSSTTTKKTATLDVSAINESRYIVCPVYTYYSGTTVLPLTLRVYRVWLT